MKRPMGHSGHLRIMCIFDPFFSESFSSENGILIIAFLINIPVYVAVARIPVTQLHIRFIWRSPVCHIETCTVIPVRPHQSNFFFVGHQVKKGKSGRAIK